MTGAPFASLPTAARLWAAAMLGALALGMLLPNDVTVTQTPSRVFVVAAVLGLVVAAGHRRTPATRRVARAATAALTVALVLALGHRYTPVVLLLAIALLLAAPPAWRGPSPRNRGVLASIHRHG